MAAIRYACSACGKQIDKPGRCADHPARRHLSTAARGYGYDHQQRRQAMIQSAIGAKCELCGLPMRRGDDLDLDHTRPLSVDPTSQGDRIVHAQCNRSRGGAA